MPGHREQAGMWEAGHAKIAPPSLPCRSLAIHLLSLTLATDLSSQVPCLSAQWLESREMKTVNLSQKINFRTPWLASSSTQAQCLEELRKSFHNHYALVWCSCGLIVGVASAPPCWCSACNLRGFVSVHELPSHGLQPCSPCSTDSSKGSSLTSWQHVTELPAMARGALQRLLGCGRPLMLSTASAD